METTAPKYAIVIPVPKSVIDQQLRYYREFKTFDQVDREKTSIELLSFQGESDQDALMKLMKSVRFKPFDQQVDGLQSEWSHEQAQRDNPIDIYLHVPNGKDLKSFRDYLARYFEEQNRKVNRTPLVMILRHLSHSFDQFAEAVTTFDRDSVSFKVDQIELRKYETSDQFEVITSLKLKENK
ncbi:MAG TPA: hypothetical protein VGN64_06170 [Dyadobacter sp.]|jgi:hypothetical protein|nr:hypothetical protein [Dyadobacter sp.]